MGKIRIKHHRWDGKKKLELLKTLPLKENLQIYILEAFFFVIQK